MRKIDVNFDAGMNYDSIRVQDKQTSSSVAGQRNLRPGDTLQERSRNERNLLVRYAINPCRLFQYR
jgi:hypothetical protein